LKFLATTTLIPTVSARLDQLADIVDRRQLWYPACATPVHHSYFGV
jgi:hypothetical protein